eukprot:TRINITY_DN43695_c0_g1_i1.p1 TRINITY_DN43695_c0_g1~~TRINITY_DN43695_c0_g1_i1.p1  ORF type:complete len:395 (+),score=79.29 TRINITY_DN43695_c0_g1_i1:72-1187(+)
MATTGSAPAGTAAEPQPPASLRRGRDDADVGAAAKRPRAGSGSASSMPPPQPPSPVQRAKPQVFLTEPIFARAMCYDDETAAVQRMAAAACDTENAELEARLGRLVQSATGERVRSAVAQSSFISSGRGERFEPGVSEEGFYHLNQHLNRLAERYYANGVKYTKTRTRDVYVRHNVGGRDATLRVTLDADSMEVKECIEKTPVATVTVSSCRKSYDARWRSAVEHPREPPNLSDPGVWKRAQSLRVKERRTYTFSWFSVDLTCIESLTGPLPAGGPAALADLTGRNLAVANEVEMEVDFSVLRREKKLPARQSRFGELCRLFVDNVRGLAAVASDTGHIAPVGAQLRPAVLDSVKSKRLAAAGGKEEEAAK